MSLPSDSSVPIRPYSPDSRIDEVETRIREYITENGMEPGTRLPGENWFAQQLEVGRPLVREAFRRLESVGLIEVKRGVGRFVRAFDPDVYLSHYTTEWLLRSFSERELAQTRFLLEIGMAAGAVERLTAEDIENIQSLWKQMDAAYDRGESVARLDVALHRVIVSRADNRLILSILDAVLALSLNRPVPGGSSAERIEEDRIEHRAIVDAAIAGDGERVRQALITHFSTTASRLGINQRWQDDVVPVVNINDAAPDGTSVSNDQEN